MEEKLELADQKVTQLSKLPEVQHELTQVGSPRLPQVQFFLHETLSVGSRASWHSRRSNSATGKSVG